MMRRNSIISLAALFCLVQPTIAMADHDAGSSDFIGLWQAIDSFDGSTQYLSITCSKKNYCDVRLNDTFFGLSCPNPPHTGFARGEGTIKRNVLKVTLTLRCIDAEKSLSQDNKFVLDRRNGILTNKNDDSESEPPSDVEPLPVYNVFHRISR